ncbi:hypothetical protein [Massilia yuzhufengensis]|uniref:Uncharacterized protein n=1 Tax=Massilia yuzhufengensis TaxID=1164594 RepID=A0A1I1QWB4_9BURK|nr:hypothetical protein [Massilia yuzhufengensis]SFD26411.1 hypothetical protein SAMN05216204_12061 [Massilia yuzhufengensis]
MAPPTQQGSDKNPAAPVAGGGQEQRSDNLLPGEEGAEDGRFDVAEEVSLDQHSDEARRVGQMPANGIADALPDALKTPVPSQGVPEKE